jgi:putative transcriptional regulator
MATRRKFKTDAFEAIHSSASAMYQVGAINKASMGNFDASCLTVPPSLKPEQIKKLRQRLRISQPVFARYLNTSESTIEKMGIRCQAA